MKNKRLIDAYALKEHKVTGEIGNLSGDFIPGFVVDTAPTVDAVFVETIEAWLYQIAMNNTDNYLCDACQEIISRLDGLRIFAKDKEA